MDTNTRILVKKPLWHYIFLIVSLLGIGYLLISSFRFFTYGDYDIAVYFSTLFRLGIVLFISSILLALLFTIHKTFENRVKKFERFSFFKILILLFILLSLINLGTYFLGEIYYSLLNQNKINNVIAGLPSKLQIDQKPISLNEKVLLDDTNRHNFIVNARKNNTVTLYIYDANSKSVKNIDDLKNSIDAKGYYSFVSSYSKDSLAIMGNDDTIKVFAKQQVYQITINPSYGISLNPKFFSKDDRYFIFGIRILGIGNFNTMGLSDDPSALGILDLAANKLTFVKHKDMAKELVKYWPLQESPIGPTADIVHTDINLYFSIDDIPQESELHEGCFSSKYSCISLKGEGYLVITSDEGGVNQLWYYSPSTKENKKILDEDFNSMDFIKILSVYPDE